MIQTEQVTSTLAAAHECSDFWFYIAIVLFAVLLYIAVPKRDNKLDKFKKANVDMSSVMTDINKSRDLYKQLSRKYHPDRFLDADKKELAEDIMKRITKHKHSYAALLELKSEAESKLK